MAPTNAQATAFFTDADQMNLHTRTRAFLDNLAEFTSKGAWEQALENCKRPSQIPDPAKGLTMNNQAYRVPAK